MVRAIAESSTGVDTKELHQWNIVVSDDSSARIEKRAEKMQPLTE
jgi:hypothetical protein